MATLTWVPDSTTPECGDPYCDWLLGLGEDFTVRKRAKRPNDHSEDFARTIDLKLAPGNPVSASPARGPSAPPARAREDVRFPMPLRERSFNRNGTEDSKAVYEVPPALQGLTEEEKKEIVIVAVIDDGINIANDRFVDALGRSRVDYAWVQDADSAGDVPYGKVITSTEIDQKRAACADEAVVLSQLGLVKDKAFDESALVRRASHGTHMADLAAGYGPDEKGFDKSHLRRMITVQLPFLMTQETSGATYVPFVTAAVKFIRKQAEKMRIALKLDRLPVVINFSYAISGGPHNSKGQVEQILEKELANDQTAGKGVMMQVVLPAGNRHLNRQHACSEIGRDARQLLSLPWRIQPCDQTSSYLEIWIPADTTPTVEISPPGGVSTTLALAGEAQLLRDGPNGDVIARVTLDNPNSDRQRILIAVAPTEIFDSTRQRAPAGLWKVIVETFLRPGEQIDAWVQRDEAPYRYRTNGRQSYFDDPNYKRFDEQGRLELEDQDNSVVKRCGTQSGLSTNSRTIVVAGYTKNSVTIARYSGRGDEKQNLLHVPFKPDVSAVSDRSRSQPGVLASGTFSGSSLPINGTSVAAPQVTRFLADLMSDGQSTFANAKAQLIAHAQGAPAPNKERGGDGLVIFADARWNRT
ncbi:S8 family serine peptidase [Pelagibius sp. Alg239-R121]|uniref:S8 family serine peptidase n=1 Tax=Pelagibius sp. Alg239-R121 TaxID=2993448 RepID=UPI0024A6286E|nr:S8 family serine peptidase [Pelagibius sp. Alg239-R121]